MTDLNIDGERLWASLMAMAEIGAIPNDGCRRLALSDEDGEARRLFKAWCVQESLSIRMDRVGNIFARREGTRPELPAICIGSHLDTQPNGGRFDGVLGVLAGLEVVRTLNEQGAETDHPIEIAVWTNEEGCRFSPAMLGSGVFSGSIALPDALAAADAHGRVLGEELVRIGEIGTDEIKPEEFGAYLELHIEQGPVLEDLGKTVGVVTGAQGIRRYDVSIEGMACHAGPFPMHRRDDPLLPRVHKDARGTIGEFSVEPSSRNVVPGRVRLTIDLRHHSEKTLGEMHAGLQSMIDDIRLEFPKQTIKLTEVWHSPPVYFDDGLVKAVRSAAVKCGVDHMDIVSGTGHDAVNVARVIPTAMIFVPCRGGISHNEAEFAEPAHITTGANVLLHAAVSVASLAAATDIGPPYGGYQHVTPKVPLNYHPK
jgi:beta-ureidopropionase / N-carbamoyl-L-amino-acid hydrolase